MRKRHVPVVLLLLVSLFAVSFACAKPAQAPAPGTAAQPASGAKPTMKPIKLRYSGGTEAAHPISARAKWFAAEVGKRTGGLVTVETYPGGELYGHAQVIEAVNSGAIEMGYTSGGFLAGRNPLHGFYNYFFLLASNEQYVRAKADLANILFPMLEKEEGLKPLHWFSMGESGYFGRKPAVNPGDMKGLMIRGPNPESNALLKLLGAVPAAIAPAELYDALAKGGIDGALSNWGTITARKFYEVTRYYTGPFMTSTWVAFMNPKVWSSLPPDIQKTIMDVGKDTEKLSFEEMMVIDKQDMDMLKTKGTLTILSREQTAAWIQAVRPGHDSWMEKSEKAGYGAQAREILKILEKAK